MLKFLKMTGEVAQDATTTAEAAVENEEVQAVSEEDVMATENHPEALVREKKAVSEATVLHPEESRVHFKEKKEHQDVLKAMTDLLDVLLKRLKTDAREEANIETKAPFLNGAFFI